MPLSSSAIPTISPKSAICSAMYETLSAVARAVSVTHVLRAAFETGLPLSSFAAAASSLVPAGSVGILRGDESSHLRVGESARRLEGVDPHVLREAARVGTRLDGLLGDVARR